jgi:uroporphyrinogen III methyltransferase/synthase
VAALDLSSPHPLEGVHVGLTGTAELTQGLSSALHDQGAQVHILQHHQLLEVPEAMENWVPNGGWLVFTSRSGMRTFFRSLSRRGLDHRCLSREKFAVIGSATGQCLWEYGYKADLCPQVFTSEALGQALLNAVPAGESITLFRSAQADSRLFDLLTAAGLAVQDLRIYDTIPRSKEGPAAVDYLVFASAGGVKAYWNTFQEPAPEVKCVCIGPLTAAALQKRSPRPVLMATEISHQGILQAILQDHHS